MAVEVGSYVVGYLEGRNIKNVFSKHYTKQIDALIGKITYCLSLNSTKNHT
jgi:hypothetical protein